VGGAERPVDAAVATALLLLVLGPFDAGLHNVQVGQAVLVELLDDVGEVGVAVREGDVIELGCGRDADALF
jgi:hypothetical protein